MRVTLIHNPTAGDRIASADDLRAMLEEAGYRVRVASTKKKWAKALQEPADLVVAAGGDGTARKVALAMAGSLTPIAVLPFGTANNTGKTLGAVGNAREIIGSWRNIRPRPLDLGIVHVEGSSSPFVESAGGGLFADLIRIGKAAVEENPVFVGRETDRSLLLLEHCARDAPLEDWGVEVDGRDCSGRYAGVEVLNVRFGGPNVPLAPDADTGDGELDVVLLDGDARDRLVGYAHDRLRIGAAAIPELRRERGSRIVIRPPAGAALHVDDTLVASPGDGGGGGDGTGGDRRVEISVDAGALRVLGQPNGARHR